MVLVSNLSITTVLDILLPKYLRIYNLRNMTSIVIIINNNTLTTTVESIFSSNKGWTKGVNTADRPPTRPCLLTYSYRMSARLIILLCQNLFYTLSVVSTKVKEV